MALDLTYAGYEYEWTRPLWDGRVAPQGVDLATVDYPNPERFTRMVDLGEFDACELSTGTYLASRATPERYPFTAIPVFPYRKLRHSYVFTRRDDDVETVTDLNGGRVGLINWQTTTGIWQRGILADRHGLDLESVEWVVAGTEIVDVDPDGYTVTDLDGGTGSPVPELAAGLESGDLDALFLPVVPESDAVVRLFDDALSVERAYVRETGIFPIMHTVVVRDSLLEAKPWVVQSLYDAFESAKALALNALEEPRWMPLAQSRLLVERQREFLGDDPWQYGLTDGNRRVLDQLLEYAVDQGVAAERYALDELFATEHLNADWFGSP
ncbi:MAG: 4,5-dihydroxyphthalate decarboxylase [Halobacteriota archaeon]